MRHVIIGSGIAGITAARTIREHDSLAEISVYTSEVHPIGLYARKDLARQFAVGKSEMNDLLIAGEADLAAQNIRIEYEEILTVFPHLQQVLKARHLRHPYDHLLIASGATPRLVEAPGLHYIGVHQLRNYEDLSLIEAWMPELMSRGAVVIGGGILGLDMAFALSRRSIPTTLVAKDEHLGQPAVNQLEVQSIQENLLVAGVEIILNETVTAYLSDDNRILDSIQLSSGRILPTRMALCTVGVLPTTGFLEESRLALDPDSGAILVNQFMQTNFPEVYAAGNCASSDGYIAATWKQSAEQGRVAALNMIGQTAVYTPPAAEQIMPLILEADLLGA